jgi:hypothetical protein
MGKKKAEDDGEQVKEAYPRRWKGRRRTGEEDGQRLEHEALEGGKKK